MTTAKQERVVEAEPEVTLGELAREALKEAKGRTEVAANKLLFRLHADKALMRQVIMSALRIAIKQQIQTDTNHIRESIVTSINRQNAANTINREKDKSRVIVLAEAVSSCLLDMPLAGGKKLRDAGHAEVMAQIDRYEKLAGNMTHKARWLRLIAQSVPTWPPGKRVGSIITEKRALELFEEARPTAQESEA